jgi:hypothetical protein
MAYNTPPSTRNLVIYEIYVRNHTAEGTFAAVEADLPRLKSMGVDVAWFMPIHPIGQLNKKGSLGCPYSIQDYRNVNPEYGTIEDFKHLVESAHSLGIQVWIDVVYNHTSHDSVLVKEHPEFFHQDENGRPFTTVPAWSDVIDLKYPAPDKIPFSPLVRYLIDSLLMWTRLGVDGFRCDVASIIPIEFWLQARQEVAQVNPKATWLAESVHASFVEDRRRNGLTAFSDSEIYAAFDLCYDYDIWEIFRYAVMGKLPVQRFLELIRFQEAIYPGNFVKMRCVENHDNWRIMKLAPTYEKALAWTALMAFCKGAFLIYGGQESAANHTPSLFDKDKVEWDEYPLQDFLARLARLKKDPAQVEGLFTITASEPVVQAAWDHPTASLYGLFDVSQNGGEVQVPLEDGEYEDALNGDSVPVKDGRLNLNQPARILRCGQGKGWRLFPCELMGGVIE